MQESTNQKCQKCGRDLLYGYLAGGGFGIAFYDNYDGFLFSRRAFTTLWDFFRGKAIFKWLGTRAWKCTNCRMVSFKY